MKICSVDLNKDMQPLMQVNDQLPGPHLLILTFYLIRQTLNLIVSTSIF